MGDRQYHFGNVYGPVHAGQGDQYVAGRGAAWAGPAAAGLLALL